ncbi:MAG: hypothetical protein HFE94_02350 [Acutalibacter sp.]|nr:hypothetical protein [Acutalibacter sp.]
MGFSFWRSKDFKRYFFVYIAVFLVFIAAGVIAVAQATQTEFRRAAARQREDQSQKIAETLDNAWNAAIDAGRYLQSSTWVQKYMADNGAFAEDFGLLRKAEYSDLLNALCATNQGIRDVSILYPKKDTAVTAAGWRSFSGYAYYMKNNPALPEEAAGAIWDRLEKENGTSYIAYAGERYLLYMCSLDILRQPRAVAVICIDKNAVTRLLSAVCGEYVAGVRVAGVEEAGTGTPYLEYGGTELGEKIQVWEAASKNMLMKYTVFHQDQDPPLFDSVWYPLAILGLVAAGVVLAYVLASFQYFPLNRLISKVNAKASEGEAAGGMYTIQAAVDRLYNENENLEHTLSSYQRLLREQTNSQLLKGNFFSDAQSSLNLYGGYWYTVLLFPGLGGDSQMLEELRGALQRVPGGQSHCELVESIEEDVAAIVEFLEKPQEEQLLEWGGRLREKTPLCEKRESAVVIARPRKGLMSISAAYQEAKETWRGRGAPRQAWLWRKCRSGIIIPWIGKTSWCGPCGRETKR